MTTQPARKTPVTHDPIAMIKARLRADLSQRQLALAVGITSGRMSEFESGVRSAGPMVLARIASVLGCEVSSLTRKP